MHGQIESAQVLALGPSGQADGPVLAHVGQIVPVHPDDPLVRHALANQRLAHLQSDLPAHEARGLRHCVDNAGGTDHGDEPVPGNGRGLRSGARGRSGLRWGSGLRGRGGLCGRGAER